MYIYDKVTGKSKPALGQFVSGKDFWDPWEVIGQYLIVDINLKYNLMDKSTRDTSIKMVKEFN